MLRKQKLLILALTLLLIISCSVSALANTQINPDDYSLYMQNIETGEIIAIPAPKAYTTIKSMSITNASTNNPSLVNAFAAGSITVKGESIIYNGGGRSNVKSSASEAIEYMTANNDSYYSGGSLAGSSFKESDKGWLVMILSADVYPKAGFLIDRVSGYHTFRNPGYTFKDLQTSATR